MSFSEQMFDEWNATGLPESRRSEAGEAAPRIGVRLSLDSDEHLNARAILTLKARVLVHDHRPVNSESVVYQREILLNQRDETYYVEPEAIDAYPYEGERIRIELWAEVRLRNRNWFGHRKRLTQQPVGRDLWSRLGSKPRVEQLTSTLIKPQDHYHFWKNLNALGLITKLVLALFAALMFGLVGSSLAVGVHDGFLAQGRPWIFEGGEKSRYPIIVALFISIAAMFFAWVAARSQLKRYMAFRLAQLLPKAITKGTTIPISALIQGDSTITLENVELRVVACNFECGQYQRTETRTGSKGRTYQTTVTHSFREPIRGLTLYRSQPTTIPAGQPIGDAFDGELSFAPMFESLYGPFKPSSNHGIDLHWEVQLIHPELADQKVYGPSDLFRLKDFHSTG